MRLNGHYNNCSCRECEPIIGRRVEEGKTEDLDQEKRISSAAVKADQLEQSLKNLLEMIDRTITWPPAMMCSSTCTHTGVNHKACWLRDAVNQSKGTLDSIHKAIP